MFRAAHAAATEAPTAAEPVKLTARTGGASIRAEPTVAPVPGITLKTPAGIPACNAVSASNDAIADESSAGFSTTVFPKASAGAAFQSGMAKGKFQGVM